MLITIVFALAIPVQPQISVNFGVDVQVPTVHFEVEPPLVVVSPGVMVVEDYREEVFYSGGYYWCVRDGAWFRTRSYRGGWHRVSGHRVPRAVYRTPRGRYKHFRGGRRYTRPHGHGGGRHKVRHHGRGRGGRDARVRDHRGGGRDSHRGRNDRRRQRRH